MIDRPPRATSPFAQFLNAAFVTPSKAAAKAKAAKGRAPQTSASRAAPKSKAALDKAVSTFAHLRPTQAQIDAAAASERRQSKAAGDSGAAPVSFGERVRLAGIKAGIRRE